MSHVYFTDRDLGRQFPAILAAAGIGVERHADLFPPDGTDEQWLEHCGRNGRIAVTHSSRIRCVPNELDAVQRLGVRLIVVVGKVPTADLHTTSSAACLASRRCQTPTRHPSS